MDYICSTAFPMAWDRQLSKRIPHKDSTDIAQQILHRSTYSLQQIVPSDCEVISQKEIDQLNKNNCLNKQNGYYLLTQPIFFSGKTKVLFSWGYRGGPYFSENKTALFKKHQGHWVTYKLVRQKTW